MDDNYLSAANPDALLDVFCRCEPAAILSDIHPRKAVGLMPYYAPEELVYAADLHPMALWGAPVKAVKARTWLPPQFCSLVQTTLELAARGTYNSLAAAVISPLCDQLRSLSQNWSEACRVPLLTFTQPQVRDRAGRDYLASRYRTLYHELCKISGTKSSDDRLWEAIRLYNQSRALRREFVILAKLLPPSRRCAVLKAAGFMDVRSYIDHMIPLNEALKRTPPQTLPTLPVITSGILADHPRLLSWMDQYGYRITADDVAAESRSFAVDAPDLSSSESTDPLIALADRFCHSDRDPLLHQGGNCLLSPASITEREKAITDLVRSTGAKAVLLLRQQFCEPEELLMPSLQEVLEKEGIPCLPLPTDQQITEPGQAVTLLETMADILS